uniref:Enoyl reductase (ER) domain-containing protein n=1 Tax=Globisporangium ultimum (strain ATCC 200006 / CBS 805.95 / DAOM BR144) TaxID=431595 RepID=K3WJB7_GLOUD
MTEGIPATFRAYQYDNYGNTFEELKLRDNVPQPALAPTEVRIQVQSAALNPVDYVLIEELGPMLTGSTPSAERPHRIGFDAAGTIVEVGRSMSSDLKAGDAVYAMTPFSGFGTFAEYVNIDEKYVAIKPTNVSFDQAASVPLAALTSYQGLLEHAKLSPGQRVLILGGSSATGIFAIQIAKAIGAHVIATTSARNADFVTSLGVDQVVDYTMHKWVDAIEPHSIDVIYDCGMEPNSWNGDAQTVLKKVTSQFVTLLPVENPIDSKFGAHSHGQIKVYPSAVQLQELTKLIEAGKVITPIDSVYPFENLADAIRKVKTRRAVGKVVLQVQAN